MSTVPLRIGIIAGESSGDILGSDLMHYIKRDYPDAIFEGMGGTRMIAEGCLSFFPLERLSVMGFIEPLKRLPELLKIRRTLIQHFLRHPPDVFIGIDSPDFNLGIEKKLKKAGIKTVHYVSPTVWAWRQGRIHQIKKAVDLMLTLFPFEATIYHQHAIPVVTVGHPLADQIPLETDKIAARKTLQLPETGRIVAILPGSRHQELHYLAPTFCQTAALLQQAHPECLFISAFPTQERIDQFEAIRQSTTEDLPIKTYLGQSRCVMGAADAILIASGTGSLEAMLVKRPTVVAYKMSPFTFWLGKKLIKVPYIALPNLLAQKAIMPEYIQDDATPDQLARALLTMLDFAYDTHQLCEPFVTQHHQLKKNAGLTGAAAIHKLLQGDCHGN